jgi:hypothetical protein
MARIAARSNDPAPEGICTVTPRGAPPLRSMVKETPPPPRRRCARRPQGGCQLAATLSRNSARYSEAGPSSPSASMPTTPLEAVALPLRPAASVVPASGLVSAGFAAGVGFGAATGGGTGLAGVFETMSAFSGGCTPLGSGVFGLSRAAAVPCRRAFAAGFGGTTGGAGCG